MRSLLVIWRFYNTILVIVERYNIYSNTYLSLLLVSNIRYNEKKNFPGVEKSAFTCVNKQSNFFLVYSELFFIKL